MMLHTPPTSPRPLVRDASAGGGAGGSPARWIVAGVLLAACGAGLLAPGEARAGVIVSRFAGTADGWTPNLFSSQITTFPDFVRVRDLDGDWARIEAPAKFRGDWRRIRRVGMEVRTDARRPIQYGVGLLLASGTDLDEFVFPVEATPIGQWSVIEVEFGDGPEQWDLREMVRSNVLRFSVRLDVNDNNAPGGTNEENDVRWVAIETICRADLNTDDVVDNDDFLLFVAEYNRFDCTDPAMLRLCPADLNDDGVVDSSDFALFVAAYNELLCPSPG